MPANAPLSDTIITVMSRMVDDSRTRTREPSHSDIEFHVLQSGLRQADPKSLGQSVGKAKRVRAILGWALEHDVAKGEGLVAALIAELRGCGGFRSSSPNFVGSGVIEDAAKAFQQHGFILTADGELHTILLENLSGRELTKALRAYCQRAQRSAEDAALVTGTGKDLLEATAAHVLMERRGYYPTHDNFPTLLGQAFVELGLKTTADKYQNGESYNSRLERALYEAACAINTLRNKQGTGHGRPWLSAVSVPEASRAIQVMGIVSQLLLDKLEGTQS